MLPQLAQVLWIGIGTFVVEEMRKDKQNFAAVPGRLGDSLYLYMMDWRMDAKGVTPIPVPMRTACWARKIWDVGAPNGPSM